MDLSPTMLALVNCYSEQFRQSFVSLIAHTDNGNGENLSSEMVSDVTASLNRATQEAARCALEKMVQSFEPEGSRRTIERHGIEYRCSARSRKTFLTQFGRIRIDRNLYYAIPGQSACCPLDEAWEMSDRFATPEVVETILFASASLDPKEIKALLEKIGTFTLSAEAIYDIRANEGRAIHDWVQTETGLDARLRSVDCPEQTQALVVGMDGANLALREAGPRRGRPQERPNATSHSNPPKQSCYKNAMVGSFSHYGTSEVIDPESGIPRIEADRLSSCYTAQMPQDRFVDFKEEFESTLDHLESQLPKGAVKMLLLDGGRPLWGYLEEKKERFADYEKLLDYFHATEHLSLASEGIFGKKSDEGARWYQSWCTKLKHEEWAVDGLIRSMNYHRKKRKRSKASLKLLDQQITFFKRNRQWLNYASYLERNLPIGSGPTEAACKTIVKERMCRSGMRWNREKGKSVLTIRAITKSQQWDTTWKEYRQTQWDKKAA